MSITFKVDQKALRTLTREPLAKEDIGAHFNRILGKPFEAAGANFSQVIAYRSKNALIGTLATSFNRHYPLVLSPDDIWLTLVQGLALHVNANSERLRPRFVQHAEKVTVLHHNTYTKGSPENNWPESFAFFSAEIEKHLGKVRDMLVSDFSTTGPVERAASEVVLMDVMKSYLDYREMTLCGIPEITLLGTPADWRSIRDRAAVLVEYDLGWWATDLMPALDRFVAASEGDTVSGQWDSFFKRESESGGDTVTGWVNQLYPYLEYHGGRIEQNAYATPSTLKPVKRRQGPSSGDYPSGLSRVPFVWNYLGTEYPMEFVAGFVGTAQQEDGAVRAAIGWGVKDA
jgi:hypothetical protein